MAVSLPSTLGALRQAVAAGKIPRRPVRSELRDNLIVRMRSGDPLFPGIIGYDETVVPQVVNAILSRHNFILLGLAWCTRATPECGRPSPRRTRRSIPL